MVGDPIALVNKFLLHIVWLSLDGHQTTDFTLAVSVVVFTDRLSSAFGLGVFDLNGLFAHKCLHLFGQEEVPVVV